MSRQELAEAVAAKLFELTAMHLDLNRRYIGGLERGTTRWPQAPRRRALRAVLGAGSDTELGFYNPRMSPQDAQFLAAMDPEPTDCVPLSVAASAGSRQPLAVVVPLLDAPVAAGDPAIMVTMHGPIKDVLHVAVYTASNDGDDSDRVLVRSGAAVRVFGLAGGDHVSHC